MSLEAVLQDDTTRAAVIDDGVAFLQDEVNRRGGVKGKAIQTAYKGFTKMRPGMDRHAIEKLLPAMAPTLDPHYEQAKAAGDVDGYFSSNADTIATDLLEVTDKWADASSNKALKKLYGGVRKMAHGPTAESVPNLVPLIEKHAG